MKYKLLAMLVLFSSVSFGQSINTQYVNGKKRVSDSIGFYPTYVGHTIDKITTAGCWWNVFDFAKNIWDTTRINFVRKSDSALYTSRFRFDSTIAAISGGGGGSGTVTSISQGRGVLLSPNPLTTTGVAAIDTDEIATLFYLGANYYNQSQVNNLVNAKIDTANRVQNLNSPNRNDVISTAGLNAELGLYPTTTTMHTAIHDSLNNLSGGTGISIATNSHIITNTAPDQTVTLNNGTGISITGVYPTYTVTNTSPSSGGTVTSVAAGAGLSGGSWTTAGTVSMPNVGTAGTYGGNQKYVGITTDAQGRVSGVTEGTATISYSNVLGAPTSLPPSGAAGGDLNGNFPNPTLINTGTAGTYGSATQVPVFTTDAQGRVSGVTNTAITFPASVTSVSGTTNRTTSTGGTTPVIDISATFEALLGKVASPLSQFASTTSAQLAGVISDETGTGNLVYSASPALTGTPTVPTATAGTNTTAAASTAFVTSALVAYTTQSVTATSYTTSVTVTSTTASPMSTVYYTITAQAGALLFAAPTGSWADGQLLVIRIKDNGTARALTYNAAFRAGTTVTAPTTTTISKTLYLEYMFNSADTKYDLVGYSDGY